MLFLVKLGHSIIFHAKKSRLKTRRERCMGQTCYEIMQIWYRKDKITQ